MDDGEFVIPLTVFENKDDNRPARHELAWHAFAERLARYDERPTKDGKAWSPVTYLPGTTRGKNNVETVHALVLDVDHGTLPLDLLESYEYIAHTTFQHTPEAPRWRVVMPLLVAIRGADWPVYWLRANAFFGGCVDPATKDSSRIFYLPSCPPGGLHEVRQQHGRLLDMDELPEVPVYTPSTARRVKRSVFKQGLAEWAQRFAIVKIAEVASMPRDSGRNDACNRAAHTLGGLVAEPTHDLQTEWVAERLLEACGQNGLVRDDGERSVRATIRSGLESGLMRAWSPADLDPPSPASTHARPVILPVAHPARIWSAHELASTHFDAVQWAIPGILPAGLTILAGRPKLGKSWLMLGWALAIAGGWPALRQIEVEQGEVLYLALEDNERRLQERIALLLGERAAPHALHLVTQWPHLDEGGAEQLLEWVEAHPRTRFIGIDTFKRVRPREQVRSTQRMYDLDYDAISPIAAMAAERNLAIAGVFHTNKSDPEDPIDLVSGTLGLSAAADAILVLKRERGKADASLFVTGRDVEEQDLALKWERDDVLGWELLGKATDFRLSRERSQILEVVTTAPGLKPADIAAATGMKPGNVRRLLFSMVRDGEVRSRNGGYFPGLVTDVFSRSSPTSALLTPNNGNAPSQPHLKKGVTDRSPPLQTSIPPATSIPSIPTNTRVTEDSSDMRYCVHCMRNLPASEYEAHEPCPEKVNLIPPITEELCPVHNKRFSEHDCDQL